MEVLPFLEGLKVSIKRSLMMKMMMAIALLTRDAFLKQFVNLEARAAARGENAV